MNATVTYTLTSDGQKASLLSGGNGQRKQIIEVDSSHPLFARIVSDGNIGSDGSVSLTVTDYTECFDSPQTIESIFAAADARKARKEAEEQAAKNRLRQASQEVLDARRTKQYPTTYSGVSATYTVPDWPYYGSSEVQESPEALAWIAELDAANEIHAANEKARQEAEEIARAEKKRLAAEKEAARRAALGLEDDEDTWKIEDGALTQCPVWESHKRGKNWMASISINPASPGGLDRSFFAKAKGDSYYLIGVDGSSLSPGDAIEFGADYYSGSGRPSRDRWYGCVVRVVPATETESAYVVLRQCNTGKDAVKQGQKIAVAV